MACECHQSSAYCQCRLGNSNCFEAEGSGSSSDPYQLNPKLDPDPENFIECTPLGLAAALPRPISNPATAGARFRPESSDLFSQTDPIRGVTETQIPLETEIWDTEGMHLTAPKTKSHRLVAPIDGNYLISGHVRWSQDKFRTGRSAMLRLNASRYIARQTVTPKAVSELTGQIILTVTTFWRMQKTDFVELVVKHGEHLFPPGHPSATDTEVANFGELTVEIIAEPDMHSCSLTAIRIGGY